MTRQRTLPPNAGEPWTEADDAELIRLIKANEKLSVIAKKLGRTNYAISCRTEYVARLLISFENSKKTILEVLERVDKRNGVL